MNFINNSSQNISVLISTYQSFNSSSNKIHKQSLEHNLFGKAKSNTDKAQEESVNLILKEQGVNVHYKTKLNYHKLLDLVAEVDGNRIKKPI